MEWGGIGLCLRGILKRWQWPETEEEPILFLIKSCTYVYQGGLQVERDRMHRLVNIMIIILQNIKMSWLLIFHVLKTFSVHSKFISVYETTYLWKTSRLSIYKFSLSVCLFVCPCVSNKRQNGWTDRAQILCGSSRDPMEGLWVIKILKLCFHQNSILIKFLKILKVHEIFWENPQTFCLFCFTMYIKRTCSQLK